MKTQMLESTFSNVEVRAGLLLLEINDLVQTVESYSNFDALRQVYR